MAEGKRNSEREELTRSLAHASHDLAERVRELRELTRAQQFRINQLEESVARKPAAARDGKSPHANPAEHRYLSDEVAEVRHAVHRLEMRLDEHEEGMRWLFERLNELRECLGQQAVLPTPAQADAEDGAAGNGD